MESGGGHDPRLAKIASSIRVIPDFPKPGYTLMCKEFFRFRGSAGDYLQRPSFVCKMGVLDLFLFWVLGFV